MQDTSKAWDRGFHDEMENGSSAKNYRFTPWGTDGPMASAYRDGRRFARDKRQVQHSDKPYNYMFA